MEVNSLFLIIKAKLPARALHHQGKKKCMKNLLCIESNLPWFKLIFFLPGSGKNYENEFLHEKNIINFEIIATFPTPDISSMLRHDPKPILHKSCKES